MGEQLAGRPSPGGEAVRRQLQALREQWQLLKQTAASQSRALGGLRSLQDFSRKAESLEAWIRSKVRCWWAQCPRDGLPRPHLAHSIPFSRRRSPAWRHSCRKARRRSSSPAASST